MRKLLLLFVFLLSASSLFAQWEQVNNGLSNTSVTSMFTYVDTLMVGTAGGGIFRSQDNGDNWTNISGNIGNTNINDIRGGAAPRVIWAATENGAFFTEDHNNYSDNTSTGLTTTDINYYWFGDASNESADWAIGTNGGGIFVSSEMTGPWTNANTGVSGNGLIMNDLSGYSDNDIHYSVMATDGGVYFSTDSLASWTLKNNGLTGDALLVKRVSGIGSVVLIATHGGFFLSTDVGDSWLPIIENEKFNTVLLSPSPMILVVFGNNGYFTFDFINYVPFDMTGITGGEVTSVAVNSTYIFVGTQTGGVFRILLDQLTFADDNNPSLPLKYNLEQNYPNPFNPSTTITYSIEESGIVTLEVYNVLGELVKSLVNKYQSAGNYTAVFNGEGLPSGIYLYKMSINNFSATKKLTLIK